MCHDISSYICVTMGVVAPTTLKRGATVLNFLSCTMNKLQIHELGQKILDKLMQQKAAHIAINETLCPNIQGLKDKLKEQLIEYYEEHKSLEDFTAKGSHPFKIKDWSDPEFGEYLNKGDLRVSVKWTRKESKTMEELEKRR